MIPFAYLALFSFVSLTESVLPENIYEAINGFFLLTPGVQAVLLGLSKLLRLCRIHRAACLIPVFSQIENAIDCYVFQFTQGEILLINTIIGVFSFAFIVYSFCRLFHGRKKPYPANA